MNIQNYLDDNVIFIVHDNFKTALLQLINESPLLDIKIITINELKKKLLFNYNEKTIYYVMKEEKLSYQNAIEYIESLYFLTNEHNNSKQEKLNSLKIKLYENNLLIYDKLFSNSLTNKKVYVLGFDYLTKLDLFLIDNIKKITSVTILDNVISNYTHPILQFKNINDEVEYIANEIIKKINTGIKLNNIYLANYNQEYESTIKRVFNFYNIPINFKNDISLYDTSFGINILNNIDNYQTILEKNKDNPLLNNVINILNKYYWAENYIDIKDMLIEEFKKHKISMQKYQEAVNIINLKNYPIYDNEHIFIIGFAEEFIPVIYKDDNLINDKEKTLLQESTKELNKQEKETWIKIIKRIKNLTITYSEVSLKGILHISPLSTEFMVQNIDYKASSFSNKSNKFNFVRLLDEQIKYGTKHEELDTLINTYENLNAYSYQNQYKKINPLLIKDLFTNGLYLSYTKIDTYFKCSFKYYLDYILNFSENIQTFEAYLGSLIHYILSKIYEPDFDLRKTKEEFIANNKFDLTFENLVFINKMCEELIFIIRKLKEHYDETSFKEIECERYLKIEKNNDTKIFFNGIIDKIMRYQDNIAIIDYKTYNPKIDLSLIKHGLKMQLPFYIYLVKNHYPNANIAGIYLQPITRDIISFDPNKDPEDIKKDNMKLVGYSIDNEEIIEKFDSTYKNSQIIRGMGVTSKGFKIYTKLLSEKNFNTLAKIADLKIETAAKNILDAKFDINPKIVDKNNISCENCQYKSICFTNFDNNIYLEADKDLTIFKEELE